MMEPRAGTPARRLQAIQGLSDAGIPAGVMFRARHSGAERFRDGSSAERRCRSRRALPPAMCCCVCRWRSRTCSGNGWKPMSRRARHVMALVRSMRGGKDYDSAWNTRMKGTGPYAEVMARRFHMAVKRLRFNQPAAALAIHKFKRPARLGDQLALF